MTISMPRRKPRYVVADIQCRFFVYSQYFIAIYAVGLLCVVSLLSLSPIELQFSDFGLGHPFPFFSTPWQSFTTQRRGGAPHKVEPDQKPARNGPFCKLGEAGRAAPWALMNGGVLTSGPRSRSPPGPKLPPVTRSYPVPHGSHSVSPESSPGIPPPLFPSRPRWS